MTSKTANGVLEACLRMEHMVIMDDMTEPSKRYEMEIHKMEMETMKANINLTLSRSRADMARMG